MKIVPIAGTKPPSGSPADMVKIPEGEFHFQVVMDVLATGDEEPREGYSTVRQKFAILRKAASRSGRDAAGRRTPSLVRESSALFPLDNE